MIHNKGDVKKMSIELMINDQPSLYLSVDKDGVVQRSTTQSGKLEIYNYEDNGRIFQEIIKLVEDNLFSRAGSYNLPNKEGDLCQLNIIFVGDENSVGLEFQYGSEGAGPPRQVVELVKQAAAFTEHEKIEKFLRSS